MLDCQYVDNHLGLPRTQKSNERTTVSNDHLNHLWITDCSMPFLLLE